MRARPNAVADRMRRLAGIARGVDSCTYDAINIGHWCAMAHASDGVTKNFQQLIQKLVVFLCQVPGAKIFG